MKWLLFTAALLFMTEPAFAQRGRDCGPRDPNCSWLRERDRPDRYDSRDRWSSRDYDYRRDDRYDRGYGRGPSGPRFGYRDDDFGRREFGYGYQSERRWRIGERFESRGTRYVMVRDYRSYRGYRGQPLRAPRYGEYYVRDHRSGDILLIAAATGLIVWALNN